MEKKAVRAERETDSHGKRILYDIFAHTHTDFEDRVRPHTHTYFEIILIEEGVGVDTCRTCIEAGANVLVAGSAVYKAEDIPGRIRALRGE